MIYVSSSCSQEKTIDKAVKELAENGFVNIELSGGTRYYEGFEKDLIRLKEKYNLKYLIHNYFPPPKTDFIINLASPNKQIYQHSLIHLQKAINLAKKLGTTKFGFHAGFFVDITPQEIGKNISRQKTCDKKKAIKRFAEGYKQLQEENTNIELYIENNVYSKANHAIFQEDLPFMLLCYSDFTALKTKINFKLLLDAAHLFVTAHSLGLDFKDELQSMAKESDYIHISDNDGLHDRNLALDQQGEIYKALKLINLHNKTITLEIYQSPEVVHESIDLLNSIINCTK